MNHKQRATQRRQTHRKRKALGRALHQCQRLRGLLSLHQSRRVPMRFAVPRIVRKHERVLLAVVHGS